ncbi:OmpH family outer membrane protein [Hydrocarboniclastica marina]|nr:OmpH family outer membrane protein [Hydrocarboniclastica marina]|tara:strand:- start:333 stop:839 length:507 start_codon:yes stop_codon:yes gene_type:complete
MRPVQQLKMIGLLVLLTLSAPLAAELKVGVIDLRRAVFTSDDAQSFTESLQSQFKGEEESIRKLQQEASAMRDRLESDGAMMNESERNKAAREFEGKVREFNQRRQQLDQAVSEQRAQFLQKAQPEIDAALENILKERELDLILPREAVVFAKPELDLTDELIKRLND